MSQGPQRERWGSRIGVILAVAGSAVGLGNFLRFPGQAAGNGGGAFMIPYFISFLLLGIPICWAEWTMGRYGGRYGFNSAPGIFSVLWRNRYSKYLGALGLLIPVIIYMYYVYIESWCLAYAYYYATGALELGKNPTAYGSFFVSLIGAEQHGNIFTGGIQPVFWFFVITFLGNFYFVYRGLNKGIETFCKIAMPLLIVAAIVVVFRVLTLPEQPIPEPWQRSLQNVLPAAKWESLHNIALDSKTTPAQMRQAVDKAFAEYFAKIYARDPAYKADIPASPPAGFSKTEEGIAVAMAELRAGELAAAYQDWVRQTRESLDRETKLGLRQLEQRQLKRTGEIATYNAEIGKRLDQFLKKTGREDDRETLQQQLDEGEIPDELGEPTKADMQRLIGKRTEAIDKIKSIAAERQQLLQPSEAVSMPSLEEYLRDIQLGAAIGNLPPSAIQQRSAALEVSELPRTVWNGLGYMWNPDFDELLNADVWIAAAGQIFFSLSVGFGIVLCYASYLRSNDDVVLSGLTASTTNEFCEVILGGLVALPATFIFLGTAMTLDIIQTGSAFALGFNALPSVFANMPAGRWFGMLWFGLLFLAGVTSSLSMLQPAIAFLEEGFGLRRRASVAALGLLTMGGALAVIYFSRDVAALDTMDFWVGSVAIYVLATIQILIFGWVLGIDAGFAEAHRGASMNIPRIFAPIIKYVTPAFLLVVFALWIYQRLADRLDALLKNPAVLLTVLYMIIIVLFLLLMIGLAGELWRKQGRGEKEVEE